jgi:hypothetical protein
MRRGNQQRQLAMQRDWSWQQARTRQETRKRSRGIHPLVVVLIALVLIGVVGGIIIAQHTGQNAPALSGQRSTAPMSGPLETQAPATAQIRAGVFTLQASGPIPVPANVLKPVNSARTMLNGEIYSIYAGSLTRQPEVGILAVLQENIQSGTQSLHLYQSPLRRGALTILSLQQNLVIFTTTDGHQGRFNLLTDTFDVSP